MALFSVRRSGGSAGRGLSSKSIPDNQQTVPMMRVRRRNDQKLLVLAGLGGLVLIAAPVVVFSQGGLPSGSRAGMPVIADVPGGFATPLEKGVPASLEMRVSPLPGASSRLDPMGRLVLVARGQGGTVQCNTQFAPSPASTGGGWVDLGGSAAGDPVLASDAYGALAVFVVGTNGNLM